MGGVGSVGWCVAWVAGVRGFVGDVGKTLVWVVWINKILTWVKKIAWVVWVKILAWVAWVHKILTLIKKMAWVAWVYKIDVGRNFGIGQKNGLCQCVKIKVWVKINIFQVFMVFISCYFIILYGNYYVLCRLSAPQPLKVRY